MGVAELSLDHRPEHVLAGGNLWLQTLQIGLGWIKAAKDVGTAEIAHWRQLAMYRESGTQ